MHTPIRRPRVRTRTRITLALAATAVLCSTAAADAADRVPHARSIHTRLAATSARDTIDVRFTEGSDVRVRAGRFVTSSGAAIAALDDVLGRFRGVRPERTFASATERELAQSRREAQDRSGRPQVDLGLFFRIRVKPTPDTQALLDALNALEMVDVATPATLPAPPPVTPSFVSNQGYRSAAAAGGIDADFAQTLVGGKGENVTIFDLEYSWNRSHEDLSKAGAPGVAVPNGTACDPFAGQAGATDHGTAVLGELAGDANGFGVTGLATGATIRTVNTASLNANGSCAVNVANAIYAAADRAAPGDVILIEQQAFGPNYKGDANGFGYVPVEWEQTGAVWGAIRNATDRGLIVIEPAANGYQDLDSAAYNDSTGRNWFTYDSGAIMVGAGNAPGCTYGTNPTVARGRLSFSNYGSRLNVQGWGSCVTTTGYGGLQGVSGGNTAYRATFSGTSSASPIVAASAAVVSSVAEARGATLTPATVRTTLRDTGRPQAYGNTGLIGPLPDLRAAIGTLGPTLTEATHVVSGANLTGTTVPVRQSWTNTGSAAVRYDLELKTDDGNWVAKPASTAATATYALERNHGYQFRARGVDAAGLRGEWAEGSAFRVDAYQENYTAANPAFSGNWTRVAWQPAADGFVSVSGTPGDRSTFSFTGTNVAWIASKGTNRGEARVYIDGVLAKTVDLYSATTSAQAIAYDRSWPQSGPHTIAVEVVGTAGRAYVDVDAFVRLR